MELQDLRVLQVLMVMRVQMDLQIYPELLAQQDQMVLVVPQVQVVYQH